MLVVDPPNTFKKRDVKGSTRVYGVNDCLFVEAVFHFIDC